MSGHHELRRREGVRFISKEPLLLERDELAFCRALEEQFGPMAYVPEFPKRDPDNLPIWRSIAEAAEPDILCFPIEDCGLPEPSPSMRGQVCVWHLRPSGHRSFKFERGYWSWSIPRRWVFDPPVPMRGQMWGGYNCKKPEDKPQHEFLQGVVKCLGKVTRHMLGHEVLRWASLSPRHYPAGNVPLANRDSPPPPNRYYQDEHWPSLPPVIVPLEVRGTPWGPEDIP